MRKINLRTIAYHVIGQPWLNDFRFIKTLVWKIFFGNRLLPRLGRYSFFGQNEVDREFARRFADNGFFVEVGSNDGIAFSNCKHLEMYKGWHGILIEPISDKLDESRMHRSKKNSFIHSAIVVSSYVGAEVPLYYSNLMTTLKFGSDELRNPLEHAEAGKAFLGPSEEIHEVLAPAKTLKQVLVEAQAPKEIDFLSLDIEGHDYEVLEDFDWSFEFRFIFVEAFSPEKLISLLAPKGYELVLRDQADNLLFCLDRPAKKP